MGKKKKGFKVVTTPSGKPKLKDEQEYTYFFHTRLKGGHVAENKKGRHFRKEKHKKRIGWEETLAYFDFIKENWTSDSGSVICQ